MSYLSALDFWGPESAENPYNELLQALFEQTAPETAQDAPGGSVSPLAEQGGGYSRGSQFQPGDLPSNTPYVGWLDSMMNQGENFGPEWEGGDRQPWQVTAAENADWIGRGVGAATGLPFTTLLAKALASRYYDNTTLANPVDVPQGQVAEGIDEMLYGDTPQQSPAGNTAIRDQAGRATDRGNTAYTGLWGPGSGSRMNRNSAFIYGMGLPGQNNAQYEPQWRTRLSGDK